ncbi:MAG: Swt1 family HEPN domain-containing protein [Saprospiraceae bacterium]
MGSNATKTKDEAANASNGTAVYVFELLCIEPSENDIQNEQALLKALAFSNRLWNGGDPKEVGGRSVYALTEPKLQITLFLKSLDTSKMLTDYSEAAYILYVEGKNFDEVDSFRLRLLRHLRNTLKFNHIRILTDDISTYIANRLYPEINKVENLLRRYLTKFFIQRVGLNWWETTATKSMLEKAKYRDERKDDFSELVDEDVSLVDFDDLGELIYKQTSGFNQPEKIIQKLLSIESVEELRHFQVELQGNYTKYFKEFFQDKHFEQRWRELFRIRNKVAHQGTFFDYDLERGLQLTEALSEIITEAESKIGEIVFSVEEKEAIRKATIEAATELAEAELDIVEGNPENYFRAGLRGLKVVGKIAIAEKERFISETEMLDELDNAMSAKYNNYVGLKWFVTTYLKGKNYVVSASYSLLNILIDKNKVELYDVKTYDGFYIKALRFPDNDDN